jgi:cysteine desulfurase
MTNYYVDSLSKYIYLDNHATTQVDERVQSEIVSVMHTTFGNPSSKNNLGEEAKVVLNIARNQVARLINAFDNEIYFTSGATESINWVLKGVALKTAKKHIITTKIEHSAILKSCQYLEENFNFTITYISPNESGLITPQDVLNAITSDTLMIVLSHANNEIGVIQPIYEIGQICSEKKILYFVDAAQSIGKIDCDVKKNKIDFLAASGHKMYAPKGIGFLYINNDKRNQITPLIHGGGQELGLRSGTENIPYIVGLGKAAALCQEFMLNETTKMKELRDLLSLNLKNAFPNIKVNGCMNSRLCNNLNISFVGITNDILLKNLDDIIVSTGSACNSMKQTQSHVLRAITNDEDIINSSIRIGVGRFTTLEDIQIASERIINVVKKIQYSNSDF